MRACWGGTSNSSIFILLRTLHDRCVVVRPFLVVHIYKYKTEFVFVKYKTEFVFVNVCVVVRPFLVVHIYKYKTEFVFVKYKTEFVFVNVSIVFAMPSRSLCTFVKLSAHHDCIMHVCTTTIRPIKSKGMREEVYSRTFAIRGTIYIIS